MALYLVSVVFSVCWWIVLIYTMARDLADELGDRIRYLTPSARKISTVLFSVCIVGLPVLNVLIALIGLSEYETIYYKSREIILERIEINELKGESRW